MLRRIAPAVGLFFLSPLVAEFLLGNLSIASVAGLLFLAPMYGGGALLIREVARRTGRGWPTIIGLALAYGMLEEVFVTQTLFNQDWEGFRILDYGYVPALGIALPWMLFMVGVHTVWSICVPIVLVETLTPGRRTTPWLGKAGLAITATVFGLFVAGAAIGTAVIDGHASAAQLGVAAVVILAIAAIAMRPERRKPQLAGAAPPPWRAGAFALVAGALFVLLYAADPTGLSPWPSALHVPAWLSVAGYLALFAVTTLDAAGLTADLISNTVITAAAIVLLVVAARQVSTTNSPTNRPTNSPANNPKKA